MADRLIATFYCWESCRAVASDLFQLHQAFFTVTLVYLMNCLFVVSDFTIQNHLKLTKQIRHCRFCSMNKIYCTLQQHATSVCWLHCLLVLWTVWCLDRSTKLRLSLEPFTTVLAIHGLSSIAFDTGRCSLRKYVSFLGKASTKVSLLLFSVLVWGIIYLLLCVNYNACAFNTLI